MPKSGEQGQMMKDEKRKQKITVFALERHVTKHLFGRNPVLLLPGYPCYAFENHPTIIFPSHTHIPPLSKLLFKLLQHARHASLDPARVFLKLSFAILLRRLVTMGCFGFRWSICLLMY